MNVEHGRKEDAHRLLAGELSWKAASYLPAKESWKSHVRNSSLEEREKKKLLLLAQGWAAASTEFRAKPGQQPLSRLQSLAGPGMTLHLVTEGWEAAGGQGHRRVLAEPGSQGPAGERLVVVPRPCRPSPARPPTHARGLQPARDLQLLKSKQSTCW